MASGSIANSTDAELAKFDLNSVLVSLLPTQQGKNRHMRGLGPLHLLNVRGTPRVNYISRLFDYP